MTADTFRWSAKETTFRIFPLAIGAWTFPGYTALYTLILNLVVAIVLTPVLNALGAKQEDKTAAADYYA